MKYVIFIDLETGGPDPTKHAITEMSAIAVDFETLNIVDEFYERIKFKVENADPKALEVQHYDPADWVDAALPADACDGLTEFAKRYASVEMTSARGRKYHVAQPAYYNAAFDGQFLIEWYKRLGAFMPIAFRGWCTLQRTMWHFAERPWLTPPPSYKLAEVCESLGIEITQAHTAADDNRASIELYKHLRSVDDSQVVKAAERATEILKEHEGKS